MTKEDIAYAAGLIDGEGCIRINKIKDPSCTHGLHYQLIVNMSSSTRILCDFVYSTFGGHVVKLKDATGKHYTYMWSTQSSHALSFLHMILPYLKLKKEQALVGIGFQIYKLRQPHYCKTHLKPAMVLAKEDELYLIMKKLKTKHMERTNAVIYT